MGSPAHEAERSDDEQAHEVEITRPFHLGAYPVTVGQWRAFAQATGYRTEAERGDGAFGWAGSEWKQDRDRNWLSPGFEQGEDHPVTCVSWNDAQEFLAWLSGLPEEKSAGRLYRLPTEAEWEHACRGGASSSTPFSVGASLSSAQANFDGNSPYDGAPAGEWRQKTVPAHSFGPNAFGLYQMHGNVWEWCADWYGEDYYATSPRRDPPGPSQGADRVSRGGGWLDSGQDCRSASRGWDKPSLRSNSLGFRVAMEVAERGLGTFNGLLREAGLSPRDVRLVRHADSRAAKGRSPYDLWHNNRPQFELYQSTQGFDNRKKLTAPYWAVFLGTPDGGTLFVGLYGVKYRGLLERDTPMPHMDGVDKAGTLDGLGAIRG
jgi:formylglycine-generating enzyme required for sulfatase activity